MLKALPALFPHILGMTSSARDEFYGKFQRKANEYDHNFIKKHDEDLNTTLIFVGFLSLFIHFVCDIDTKFLEE